MLTLRLIATLLGLFSAGMGAYLALRASMVHRRAHDAQLQADEAHDTRAGALFERLSRRIDTQAGWRPSDHRWLIVSIGALAASYMLNLLVLLLGD